MLILFGCGYAALGNSRSARLYDPYLRRWCRGYDMDADSADEIRRRIWSELAERMRTFEYDPSGSFRGWLRRLCESRVIDFLHERRTHPSFRLDGRDDELEARRRAIAGESGADEDEAEGTADSARLLLICQGEQVQAAVRAKVQPRTWEAFWLVAVYDWSVEETARALGMSKAAVYAAKERVARRLREEGRRVLDVPTDGD